MNRGCSTEDASREQLAISYIRMWDLFSRSEYQAAVEQGLIRVQQHPDLPLWIHNYTDAATYTKGAWDNQAVLKCRGLVTDVDNRVVARPFDKFFNHNQPEAGSFNISLAIQAFDKLDGSLGILYPTGRQIYSSGFALPEYAIATRGSFVSDQAVHATEVWKSRYEKEWTPNPHWTYLFEIIYPENRIVLDYKGLDDLVLLGSRRIDTEFNYLGPEQCHGAGWWPGPKATTLPYRTLKSALAAEPRKNAEGIVVIYAKRTMVKIKQEDYLIMHRLMTGFSARSIWEFLAVHACKHLIEKSKHWGSRIGLDPARAQEILDIGPDWKATYLENCPDEFLQWVDDTIEELEYEVYELDKTLRSDADELKKDHSDRRSYFAAIKNHEHFGLLGLLYDDKDITTALWKTVYPSAEGRPFIEQGEDIA